MIYFKIRLQSGQYFFFIFFFNYILETCIGLRTNIFSSSFENFQNFPNLMNAKIHHSLIFYKKDLKLLLSSNKKFPKRKR